MFALRRHWLLATLVWWLLSISGPPSGMAQGVGFSERVIEVEPLYSPVPQSAEDRQWVDASFTKVFSVSEGKNYFLYGATEAARDSAGYFYVLDRQDRRIKKFDADGAFIRAIGAGRGPGPAQFEWPIDFAVAPDGETWVIDAHRRKLSRFSSEGSIITSFPLDGTSAPKSIALTSQRNAIVLSHGAKPLFRKWSPNGTLIQQFGTLIEDQVRSFVALDGIVRGGRNGFVFAPNRASHLIRFSADSTLQYAVATMDNVPYPNVIYSSKKHLSLTLDPIRRLSTLDIEVENGNIYYYSHAASSSKPVIDVFRYSTGEYRYSFKAPVPLHEFGISSQYFMSISSSSMTVFKVTI